MGDIIHLLPALTDAIKNFTDIEFTWVIEENFAEIPNWHANVKQVITIGLRRWLNDLRRTLKSTELTNFLRSLGTEHYDFIIDAQGLFKSAIVTRLARGVKCGLDWRSAKEPLASLFYQRCFHVAKQQHAIARIRELFAKVLNYPIPTDYPESGINLPVTHGIESDEKYLVFIHGTTSFAKSWHEDNWINLAKLAKEDGYKVYLPAFGKVEKQRVARITDRCDNTQIIASNSLTDIAKMIQGAVGVIAVDTGLGHLAAALQTPVISLYGPTDEKMIGTYGKNAKHLAAESRRVDDIKINEVWDSFLRFPKC